MRKLAICLFLLFLVPAAAVKNYAQEAHKAPEAAKAPETVNAPSDPAHFYRLDFVIEELDAAGKPVNSRSFTTTVSTAGSPAGSITTGSKIPIATGTYTSEAGKPQGSETQFQYIDVGVKIQPRDVHEAGSKLTFNLLAEVSSQAEPSIIEGVSEPVFRQNIWNSAVLIPIGKPTVVFKSDSLDSKGSMQLVVTASRLDTD